MNTDAAQPELRNINTMLRFQATKPLGKASGPGQLSEQSVGAPDPFGGQRGYFWYTLGGRPAAQGGKIRQVVMMLWRVQFVAC